MEIQLDHQEIQSRIANAVNDNITNAMTSWDIKKQIADAVEVALGQTDLMTQITASISRAIDEQMEDILLEVTQCIAPAIAMAVKGVTVYSAATILSRIETTQWETQEKAIQRIERNMHRLEEGMAAQQKTGDS